MIPPRVRLTCIAAALAAAAASCSSSDATSPSPSPAGLQVTVETQGFQLDPDGYEVRVGSRSLAVGINGSVEFPDLDPGAYRVELTGLAENCSASTGTGVDVTLSQGERRSVSYSITCAYDMSGAALPVVACPGMAPAVGHGLPGEEIGLGTVPGTLTPPLFARVSWAGGDEAGLAYVDPATATMVAPLHPGTLREGGVVQIRISDEAGSCAPFPFTVDALPPAPGELAAVVDLWQELLDAQAALAGVTVSDLRSRPIEDFPPPVWGLHVAQSLLDHPGTANSLRAVADGAAPDAAGLDRDFLDAALALTGMRAAVQRRIAAAQSPGSSPGPSAAALESVPILTALACLEGIDQPSQLDRCMSLARDKIVGPIEEQYLQDLGNVLNFLGTLPVEYPPLKTLVQVVSGFVLLEKHYSELLAGALPTEFVSMQVEADPPFFYEDTPGPGSWAPAWVVARSKGYSTTDLMIDVMVEALKLSESYNDFMKAAGENAAAQWAKDYFGGSIDPLLQEFLTNVIGFYGSESVKGLFKASLEGPGIPPQQFGPIPLLSEEHVTSRMVLDEFVVRTGHDELDPRKPGVDYLHVKTAEGRFGGARIETDPRIPIEVRQLDLQFRQFFDFIYLSVTEIFVSPGDTVPLELVVSNAQFPRMVKLEELLPQWGSAELTLGGDADAEGSAVHTVRYIAPQDLKDLPGELTAVSTATTGALQYAGGFRRGKVVIRGYEVEITTEPPCLEPGDTLQLDVQVKGVPEDELVWSTDAGTVTQSGLFVAPGDESTVTVTVEWSEDPRVKDSILLQVGSCSCQATLVLDGAAPAAERLTFYLAEDLSAVREVAWAGFLSTASFTFGSTPGVEEAVALGATGTFPAVGGGYVDGVGNFANLGTAADPTMTPLSASIAENEGGNVLAGSISGWVELQDLENPVAFSLTYRIAADPAFSTATERRCYVN